MKGVLAGAAFSLLISLLGTPLYIRFLVKRGYGQFVRDDGPTTHHTKRGTPTMGGAIIIIATVGAYLLAHLVTGTTPSASGLLVLFLMGGLGLVGFLDDFIKISNKRSLGLNTKQKLAGQALVGVIFAALALLFPNDRYRTPASPFISFVRDTNINLAFAGTALGVLLFIIWANIMIAGTSNGVNLTDGLDGLATGVSTMVFGSYVLISLWVTWAPSRSVARSPGWRSPLAPSCSLSSSAACSSSKHCRSWPRSRPSNRPVNGCCGWHRSTTTSSCWVGTKSPLLSGSGSSLDSSLLSGWASSMPSGSLAPSESCRREPTCPAGMP